MFVQIPPNLWWLTQARGLASVLTIALAIIGPLALLLVRCAPGPVIAFVAVAAGIDFVVSERMQGGPFVARELHDVLAHSLSQINGQAGVGLYLMEKQPAKAAEALASIKETSKTALDEVRPVLGLLRAEDGQDPSAPLVPEPDLSRLAGLVASVISQGVVVTMDGEIIEAPKAAQLAIYRIVREYLTNVVRHANAASAMSASPPTGPATS